MNKNVQKLVEEALCTGCGACNAVCPKKAVQMEETPSGYLAASVDFSKCIECGLCLKVCPSCDQNTLPIPPDNDPFHGACLHGFWGHAVDDEIRQKSQSGGIVTALLLYLIESKQIEAAVINKYSQKTHRAEAFPAADRAELLSGCGSYYCQSSVAKTALENADKKLAAVVLGCQAESLSLALRNCPSEKKPILIGLICGGQNSAFMLDELVRQSGVANIEDVKAFRYKDKSFGNWPGNVAVTTRTDVYTLSQNNRHALKKYYEAYRCLLCFDQMNIFSDIVCGDPWGIEEGMHPQGESVVIVRTQRGLRILEEARKAGYIAVEDLDIDRIFTGQTVDSQCKSKFCSAAIICQKHQWRRPYNSSISIPRGSFNWRYENRLKYTRSFYLSQNKAQRDEATEKYDSALRRQTAFSLPRHIAVCSSSRKCIKRAPRST